MENWEIIKWVLGAFGTVIAWLVINNLQQDKKLISIENTVGNVEKKVDRLSDQLTLFLKNEIDALKDLANKAP
jgi:alpha/beta superfamily hydrolase